MSKSYISDKKMKTETTDIKLQHTTVKSRNPDKKKQKTIQKNNVNAQITFNMKTIS